MIDEDERELAAALVAAIEAGLLSMAEAIRVVDREIPRRPSPGQWLLGEIWPLLEAMERSLLSGALRRVLS